MGASSDALPTELLRMIGEFLDELAQPSKTSSKMVNFSNTATFEAAIQTHKAIYNSVFSLSSVNRHLRVVFAPVLFGKLKFTLLYERRTTTRFRELVEGSWMLPCFVE